MFFSSKRLRKTQDTIWPGRTPKNIQLFLERFFDLLDGYTPEAGKQWSLCYSPEGEFEAFGKSFKGHEAIAAHIMRFWKMFPGLAHTPQKVHIHRDGHYTPILDVIVVTSFSISFSEDNCVSGESVAVMKLENRGGKLHVLSNRLFLDPGPLMAAYERNLVQIPDSKPTSSHQEHAAGISVDKAQG